MATSPKPGGRNDLDALRQARRFNREISTIIEDTFREVDLMRERVGRPDYGPIKGLLGQLAQHNAKVHEGLQEMWTLRAMAGQTVDHDLAERVAMLEAQLAELQVALGEAL